MKISETFDEYAGRGEMPEARVREPKTALVRVHGLRVLLQVSRPTGFRKPVLGDCLLCFIKGTFYFSYLL